MGDPKKRILVASADPAKLQAPLRLLRDTPHEITVLSPADSVAGLDGAAGFDLLIVDIEPPELAGFDVVRAWRRQPGGERPVLAVSRAFKWWFASDKRAFRAHLERLAAIPGLTRVIVAHGKTVEDDPARRLREAAAGI